MECDLCALILAEARQTKPIPAPGTVMGHCIICDKDVVYPNVMTRWRRAREPPPPETRPEPEPSPAG